MWHYVKFFHYYLTTLLGIVLVFFGGHAVILGFMLFVGIYILGDSLLGDDISQPELKNKTFINLLLYGSLPLTLLIFLSALWLVAPNDSLLFIGINKLLPDAILAITASVNVYQLIIAIILLGFLISGVATVVAHELVHRVNKRLDVCLGRWLMAFSFDANFSIEHVYNHHTKVGTQDDPVTAPRGRNVYIHFIKGLILTNISSWEIESKRLKRAKQKLISLRNRCIRGYAMSLTLCCLAFLLAGWQGLLMFIAIGISAKFILEVVNYMEHYGLVRDPKSPVQPYHSWNSNKKVSNWSMFNLARHSHHHARPNVPFEKLQAMQESPKMIAGYISTIGLTLIPPLWFKLMKPKLDDWDRNFASDKELAILQRQKTDKQQQFLHWIFY